MNTNKLVRKLAVDYLNEGMKGYYENGANVKKIVKLYEYRETIGRKKYNVIKTLQIYNNGYLSMFNRMFLVKPNPIKSSCSSIPKARVKEKYPRVRRRYTKN